MFWVEYLALLEASEWVATGAMMGTSGVIQSSGKMRGKAEVGCKGIRNAGPTC